MNQKQRANRASGFKAMELAPWKWRERHVSLKGLVGVKVSKYEPHQGFRERVRRQLQGVKVKNG